jgi:hypothetical protein
MNLVRLLHLNKTTVGKEVNFYFWWGRITYDTVSICTTVGVAKSTEHRSHGGEHRRKMDGTGV